MTVQELIAHLETMPPDALVAVRIGSQPAAVDADEVILYRAEDKQMVLRNGQIMDYAREYWPSDETPQFVTVCHFPGN